MASTSSGDTSFQGEVVINTAIPQINGYGRERDPAWRMGWINGSSLKFCSHACLTV